MIKKILFLIAALIFFFFVRCFSLDTEGGVPYKVSLYDWIMKWLSTHT